MAEGRNPQHGQPLGQRHERRDVRHFVADFRRGRQPLVAAANHDAVQKPAFASHFAQSARHVETVTTKPIAPSKPRRVASDAKPALPRQKRSLVLRRQIVDKAAIFQQESKEQRKRFVWAFVAGSLVASVITAGIFGVYLVQRQRASIAAAAVSGTTLGATTHSKSSAEVSEAPMPQDLIDSYATDPAKPRLLTISKIGLHARILPVEPTLNKEPATTDNIHDVGWLSTSAVPGQPDVAILNGFVSGPTKPGAFGAVNTLGVGDVIQVERGDGKRLNFKVIRSQLYDADAVDMKAVGAPAIAGQPGLNLLSNTGRYNARTNKFEQRLAVFTVLQ